MLLVDEDYYHLRNSLTSDFVTNDNLYKIAMKLMEKPKKREESGGLKRCYSQHINDKILDCFSVSKEDTSKQEEKIVKVTSFCKCL